MAIKFAKTVLWSSKKTLDLVKEKLFFNKLDWECISKPLKEDPNDLVAVHCPTIEEYRRTYSVGGKVKPIYDWWYSAILKNGEEKFYFLIVAFHPKWSFYRVVNIDINKSQGDIRSTTRFSVVGDDFNKEISYSEHEDTIDLGVSKTRQRKSSGKSSATLTIRAQESHLSLQTSDMTADLIFSSLGSPFWINKGREAICSPKGDTMSGFYDICQVKGFITQSSLKGEFSGVGVNEHLMSFTPPKRFWKRVDGVFFCADQIYGAFVYLRNEIGTRQYEYKDGAVVFRTSKEYLIPLDFKIEYLESSMLKKVPQKIRIIADTTKGKLNVVTQAMAETEKQLVFKILEGQFMFKDGRKLRLTNGYGQHALQ